jgi:hypothetical protein
MAIGTPLNRQEIWIEEIEPARRDAAVDALEKGDVIGFLGCTDNAYGLKLVFMNIGPLRTRGLYETALVNAFTAVSTNHSIWRRDTLAYMFSVADRERLRQAGDPLPKPPYTVYRGVAGRGRARRVCGYSWTRSLERAKWFANRFSFHDPAVYSVTVDEADILAYINDRNEQEFIVDLPRQVKPVRMKLEDPSLVEGE